MTHSIVAPFGRSIVASVIVFGLAGTAAAEDVHEAAVPASAVVQTEAAEQEPAGANILILETVPVHRPALEFVSDEIADQHITCSWEAPVGSRVLRKRCVTEEHRRIVSEQWQDWLRQAQMAFSFN